jgi:hypothetical protein
MGRVADSIQWPRTARRLGHGRQGSPLDDLVHTNPTAALLAALLGRQTRVPIWTPLATPRSRASIDLRPPGAVAHKTSSSRSLPLPGRKSTARGKSFEMATQQVVPASAGRRLVVSGDLALFEECVNDGTEVG